MHRYPPIEFVDIGVIEDFVILADGRVAISPDHGGIGNSNVLVHRFLPRARPTHIRIGDRRLETWKVVEND